MTHPHWEAPEGAAARQALGPHQPAGHHSGSQADPKEVLQAAAQEQNRLACKASCQLHHVWRPAALQLKPLPGG